jgi:hypothetical protein
MLYSTLSRLSKLLLGFLIIGSAQAFDSSDAYNTITFSYIDQAFVRQTFVLSGAQQSTAQSFKLTVDAKDGGGRPTHNLDGTCAAYCSQFDTARIEIVAYNSSGGVVSTKTAVQDLKNWGSSSNPGWSARPGDNLHPWTQMTVSVTAADVGGSFADVARIEVRLVNQNEGSFWAGNYGVQFRTPTLQVDDAGSNLLYNSEFGVDSTGIKVQGWQPSYNTYVNCGTTSGSSICTTQEAGVTANMWGGGEDPNGGTVNSQPGGYNSVLTSDNADTAASGGDIGGGSSTTPPPPTPVYRSSAITNQQASRRSSNLAETTGHNTNITITGDGNDVYILQAGTGGHYSGISITGNTNNVDVNQTSNVGARHYLETTIIGSSNLVNLRQSDSSKTQIINVTGNLNNISTNQKGTGSHFIDLIVSGDGHLANVVQDGTGNHEARIVLDGTQPWNFNLNQNGSISQKYSLPHDMSDNSVVLGTCNTIGGCNLSINQNN